MTLPQTVVEEILGRKEAPHNPDIVLEPKSNFAIPHCSVSPRPSKLDRMIETLQPISTTGGPTAPALVERLTDSGRELKLACYELLDSIKRRYPNEPRDMWKCPHFARISKLIDFH